MHNNIINQNSANNTNERYCNCRVKADCPLEGKCLTKSVVYQAKVIAQSKIESYIGMTEGEFKTRYRNHISSFSNADKKHATELSKYIWSLKEKNIPFTLNWYIVSRAKAYSNNSKRCGLCLKEKFFILYRPELSSLNKRGELISTCRHSAKFALNKT